MPGRITTDKEKSRGPADSACDPAARSTGHGKCAERSAKKDASPPDTGEVDAVKALVIQHAEPEPPHDGLGNTPEELRALLKRADGQWRKAVYLFEIMQQQLQENARELEICSRSLQEANIAIKLLLAERDEERRASEERVVCNINDQIRPHFSKLMNSKLNRQQRTLLDAIASSLDDITSPLSRRFTLESSRLSPVQIRVAGMIRQGRTTKEIATILGVAVSTVDFHRNNIRRKLNLINSRTNLQAYLQSLA